MSLWALLDFLEGAPMVEAVPLPKKENRFKKGDVVFLRSGQGPMNVLEIQTNDDIMCGWPSDLGEWQEAALPPEVLCTKEELEETLARGKAQSTRRKRITREPPRRRASK